MPTGVIIPIAIGPSIVPAFTTFADQSSFLTALSATDVRTRQVPKHDFVILFDRSAEDNGQAVNAVATDLLWSAAPSTYPAYLIHGPALLFGYVDGQYCDLPEHITRAISEHAAARASGAHTQPDLRLI